jgi:hypothetical protein
MTRSSNSILSLEILFQIKTYKNSGMEDLDNLGKIFFI